jgi:hypothetical protein
MLAPAQRGRIGSGFFLVPTPSGALECAGRRGHQPSPPANPPGSSHAAPSHLPARVAAASFSTPSSAFLGPP